MKLRVLPKANGDLNRLYEFLFSKNPSAADRMVSSVRAATLSLKEFPAKGRPMSNGFRELLVPFGKAAYVIRYRIREAEQEVVVARVWHSRERRA